MNVRDLYTELVRHINGGLDGETEVRLSTEYDEGKAGWLEVTTRALPENRRVLLIGTEEEHDEDL